MTQATKPSSVVTAIKLLYLALIIGVTRIVIEWPYFAKPSTSSPGWLAMGLLITTFAIGLMIWLIQMMNQRCNWARITLLVLCIADIPYSIIDLFESMQLEVISGLFGVAQIALRVIALIKLFSPDSSRWFKQESVL